MSVQAMTRVMEHSEAEGITRLVLLVMANRAGGDHDECFASVDRLAHDCRVSRRTVQYATARLVASGDLAPAGIHARHRTNVYRVMPARGVQTLHGGADSRPGYAPELKELGVKGSGVALAPESTNGSAFDEFWSVYPREGRRDKPKARVAFKAAVKKAAAGVIIAAARSYAEDPNRDPGHTKYAQGWLSGERWNDPPLPERNGHRADLELTDEDRAAMAPYRRNRAH